MIYKKKRIIISSFRGFGIYNSRFNLIKKLRQNDWDIYIFTKNDEYCDLLKKEGLKFMLLISQITLLFTQNIRNIIKITYLIKKLKPELFMHLI